MPKEKIKGKLSKGLRFAVDPSLTKSIRADRSYLTQLNILRKAWSKGYNPWVSIDNPNGNETNKRKIKVKLNSIWGKFGEKKRKIVLEESLDNPIDKII